MHNLRRGTDYLAGTRTDNRLESVRVVADDSTLLALEAASIESSASSPAHLQQTRQWRF